MSESAVSKSVLVPAASWPMRELRLLCETGENHHLLCLTTARHNDCGPVAQRLEQGTHNP